MPSVSQGRTYRWLQRNDHDHVVVFSRFYILIVIGSGGSLVIQYKSNVRDLALIDRRIVSAFYQIIARWEKCRLEFQGLGENFEKGYLSGWNSVARINSDTDVPWLVKIGGMCNGIIFQFQGTSGSRKRK